jgi:protein TonB
MTTLQIGLAILATALVIAAVIYGIKRFADPSRIREKYAGSPERSNIFVKKYKEADTSYYQGIAARIGFIVVILMLIAFFNYSKSEEEKGFQYTVNEEEIIEQDIPVTKQTVPPKPPPPPPPPQIEVVENEEVIEAEVEFEEQEIDIDAEFEIWDDTSLTVMVEVPEPVEETEEEAPEIFVVVEDQPAYPGGTAALIQYLGENITYPPPAQESGIQGTVVVRFVVNERGDISDIVVLKDIGHGCGDEAVRVVDEMPTWKPGRQRGKAVKVYYTLPVRFKLE